MFGQAKKQHTCLEHVCKKLKKNSSEYMQKSAGTSKHQKAMFG